MPAVLATFFLEAVSYHVSAIFHIHIRIQATTGKKKLKTHILVAYCSAAETGRPIYTPTRDNKEEEDGLHSAAEDTVKLDGQAKTLDVEKRAPRSENGELIWKRREVHSGRALTVSTVEWSVAEKTATPTSTLEGFMWDKETEVDRFRERVPLSNLVSQSRLSQMDPSTPKRRDWIGPVQAAAASSGKFVIIPECKRTEPVTGSLRKRYDLNKLAKEFTVAGVPALSVNCDAVLFGGTLDDITTVREASSKAALEMSSNDGAEAPPIMASDLLLYPYQLYKLSLAGADAVNLIVGALAAKDLVYLTKIASSLKLQTLVSVTSAAQIKALSVVAAGGVNGLIVSNRELEDFSFDMTGQQALDILKSDELKEFKEKHGADIPVLVEGRVGIIEWKNEKGETSAEDYLFELKRAGAIGAIVGGGLVNEEGAGSALKSLMQAS
jgi:indole-3-glycerol phosphate synthase